MDRLLSRPPVPPLHQELTWPALVSTCSQLAEWWLLPQTSWFQVPPQFAHCDVCLALLLVLITPLSPCSTSRIFKNTDEIMACLGFKSSSSHPLLLESQCHFCSYPGTSRAPCALNSQDDAKTLCSLSP